jgi:hypothetical protein
MVNIKASLPQRHLFSPTSVTMQLVFTTLLIQEYLARSSPHFFSSAAQSMVNTFFNYGMGGFELKVFVLFVMA